MHFAVIATIAVCLALAAPVSRAQAACSINGAGMSVGPTTANAGSYTAPAVPAAQAVALTLTGTYTTNGGGTCRVAISFQRATLPATMANLSGGGSTLAYTLTDAPGGSTVVYAGGGASMSTAIRYSFSPAGNNLTNAPFTAPLTVYLAMQPTTPQAGGTYNDILTFWAFDGNTNTAVYSRSFIVSGTVNSSCTIGGVSRPTADSATIPITAAGAVTTATINRAYANVTCTSAALVQAASQNGAVRNVTTAPSGFTNLINYTASATFAGATSTLNTATIATAAGSETGSTATTGGAPSGTLSVAITPHSNAQRLIAGTYSDVLTVTLTPQ